MRSCGAARDGLRQMSAERVEEVVRGSCRPSGRERRARAPAWRPAPRVRRSLQREQRVRVALRQSTRARSNRSSRSPPSSGVCSKAGTPAASASLSSGSAVGSSAAPGWRRRDTSAKRARKGVWTRNDAVAAVQRRRRLARSSPGAPPGRGRCAAKVSAMSANSCAWTSATGATSPRAAPSAGNRSRSSLRGLDRLRMTGVRCARNGRSCLDRLVDVGAAAGEARRRSPAAPSGVLTRVAGWNVESTSSSSGAGGVALRSGMVSPASKVCSERPGSSSTYLSPSAERGRTLTVRVHRERLDVLVELELEQGDRALLAVHLRGARS